MRQARFLRPAEADVTEAIAYFDEQRNGLGDRFEQDLLDTVEFVRQHPLSGKLLTSRVRRFRFNKFRYNVVYVIEDDEVVILAVAHHRRRPGYWRGRLATIR